MEAHQKLEEFFRNNSKPKHAEKELIELTRRLAEQSHILDTALSTIPDFAYIFDCAGRFIYANQALLNLWGLRLEDAVGKNFFDLQYPADLAANLQRQINQVIETKQGLTDETPYTSPTGAGGYYEYIFRPVFDADGAVAMVAGSTRDITEHARAKENLRRTQARLDSALKAGLAGTFYWDINANRVITDENMMRYFSLSEQATSVGVALAEVLDAIYDEDRSKVEQAIAEAVETKGAYSIEYRVNHSDGKVRWLSARGLIEHDETGGGSGLPGFVVDITERKRAEESIRFQARLLDTVEQAVIATDLTGTIIYWNRFAESLYGWSRAEVIGRNIIAVTSSAAMQEQAAEIMSSLKLGKSWSGEFMVQQREGITFPAYITNTPIYDDEGGLIAIVGVSSDISERKRVEEVLRESEERLRAIFEASRDGILVEDDERIIYINQSYTHLLGYDSPEELIGKHVSTVIAPEDADRMLEFGRSRARGELPASIYEFNGRHKNGTAVDVEASVSTSNVAGRTYITTMVRDIAERKRSEKALRESEERFRAAFEQANVGIVQSSFDGILQMVNPGFCKILGYSEAEARGLPIREITHPEDHEKEAELTRCLMAGEIAGYSLEKRYLHKDGEVVWGQMTATIVRQESGAPFYMLAIIEDITERKRAEAELKQINEELEGRVAGRTVELMEMNANLQAEISERRRAESERTSIMRRLVMVQEDERRRIARDMHDHFGQQLTALLLRLGLLKEDCGDLADLADRGDLADLREQIETVQAIAKQLDTDVDFLVWELRPIALDDLGLQAALTNYTQNWSKHFGIPAEVHAHGLEKVSLMWEIDTVLYRIAQEALNNIAKHAHAANVTVLLERRAETISLIIEDDGSGFDAENAFGANDKGLGLVGMRERAALVGGTVEIESQPGEGTTVYVRIPAPLMTEDRSGI